MKGQSIIEFIIAMALAAILLPGLITGLVASREGKAQQGQRLEASVLLKEAQEAARVIRENSWSTFSVNGTYQPVVSGNTWSLSSGSQVINGYNRSIIISDVYRDASGTIVATGGIADPSTKKVVSNVSWNTPFSSSVTSTMYLSRILRNNTFLQMTESDFNTGTMSATVVTNTNGGEVILGAGGWGNWCNPGLTIATLDLPKQGVANALYAIQGQAFAGTGNNASGVSFANISIGNPPYPTPPPSTITGTFDGYKTNDGVFGETNYAYLATDNNFKEVVIVDLTQKDANNKYLEVGYFNAPGNGTGKSVYVSGNIGFMISGNRLYTFDLSIKSGSRPQLGSVTLASSGTRVIVNGSYAFISLDSETTQMQIIQIGSGGTVLSVVGQATVAGDDAKSLFINSTATRAYIVTETSLSQRELFIVDISSKTGNRPTISSYDTNGMNPKGITAVPGNKLIVVGTNGEEYQVINVTNETSPSRCGGLNIDSGVNGVSGVLEDDGDAYAYIITGDATSEFKIIEGGPGGQFALSGTFESDTLASPSANNPSTLAFNRFIANIAKPQSTDITIQVAAAEAQNNSCSGVNFTFVGPDATTGNFYTSTDNSTIAGAIPFSSSGSYKNPASCFRYKAYFSTTDKNNSPVLYDFTVNYSP